MMEDLTLVINNPDEGHFLKSIGWNKEQIKEAVVNITEQYRGLSYTEEQLQEAKADRAKLNAMKKDISDRRVQVKQALLEPYEKFEAEVNEVVALIDEPIAMIDKQIVAYEERTKKEKRQALEDFFEKSMMDIPVLITFDKIFNPKWLNRTASLSSCKKEIKKAIEDIVADVSAIRSSLSGKYSVYAEEFYLKREMNLSRALSEANRIQEMDRKAEEEEQKREKIEEEAKIQREMETQQAREHQNSPQQGGLTVEHEQITTYDEKDALNRKIRNSTDMPIPQKTEEQIQQQIPAEEEKLYRSAFMVRATKAKLMMLRDYMVQNGIEFSKIENQ